MNPQANRSFSTMRILHRQPATCLAALLFAAILAANPATAQNKPPATASSIEENPLVIEELGVSINPPLRSAISREVGADGRPTITIADASPSPVWQLRIQALIPTIENPTPASLIEDHISKLKESGHELTVLTNSEVMVGTVRGWKAYLADALADDPLVNGYLIVPGQGPPFIVFSFVCTLSDFAKMRATLEQSLDSVKLDSPARIAKEREDHLKAGAALLASFDATTLKKLVGFDQWYRLYKPAGGASGDIEIGVMHVNVKEGKRGELNVDRKESQYDTAEQKVGLLLTVQARIVIDSDRDLYYDSLNLYWMGWDDDDEAWSIVASRRQKANSIAEAETGYRGPKSPGNPSGALFVIKSGVDGARRDPKQWPLPEFYLSQPLGWLLGNLMASNDSPAGEFLFYAYDSTSGSVTLRQDSWLPSSGGGTLTTRLSPHTESFTSQFDSKGNLVKRTRKDGSVTAPTTPEEIKRLWEMKSLKLRSES